MLSRLASRILALSTTCALLASCGSEPTPPPPPAATPTLAVTVGPSAFGLVAGQSGSAAVTIVRGGGFAGTVDLTASGAPSGVTVTLTPATLGSGNTSSDVVVQTATSVSPATFPITITATGSGVTAATTTLTITVTAAPVPSITLTVAPTTVSIIAGETGTATATIARGGGFTGPVTLSATNAPTGITATIASPTLSAAATSSSITLAVDIRVAAGTYPITITAAGTGPAPTTAILSVTVTPPTSSRAVTLAYCAADAPIWLAFQDGGMGPWVRVLPNAGTSTYAFTMLTGKAGVASVDTVGTGYRLNVSYLTADETQRLVTAALNGGCASKTITGSVANVPPPQDAFVSLGFAQEFVDPAVRTTFSLTDVASGPQDLVAFRSAPGSRLPDRVILRRGLDVPQAGTLPVLDFGSAEGFAPALANVTLTNIGADTAFVIADFIGTRGAGAGRVSDIDAIVTGAGARQFAAIPADRLNTGEFQQLYAAATAANTPTSDRVARLFFRTAGNRTVALGPALSVPTVTRVSGGAYARARFTLPVQADYARLLFAAFDQVASDRLVSVYASAGFTGGGAWDVTVPALSGTAGWQDTWGLQNGAPIEWFVGAIGGAMPELDATLNEGDQQRSAYRSSELPLQSVQARPMRGAPGALPARPLAPRRARRLGLFPIR
ncbi:MAG: hypothetical protein U5K74_00615 [Gemmatimonadaceae bacterium]|nr:hypothetical protein [Gemmatimonadaceae bacterium]